MFASELWSWDRIPKRTTFSPTFFPKGFLINSLGVGGIPMPSSRPVRRRFPSPRSCALTPTFLQVLYRFLPRNSRDPTPLPSPLPAHCLPRNSLSPAQLSRSTLDAHAHTHALSLSLSTPLRPRPRISDRHAPLDRREARGGVRGVPSPPHL